MTVQTFAPIRVEIDESEFWRLAKMPVHPITKNLAVIQALRDAGIPVDADIEFKSVKHGRITMYNERTQGRHLHIYEWTPGPDSARFEGDDDEL